jgi:hypothetical protein
MKLFFVSGVIAASSLAGFSATSATRTLASPSAPVDAAPSVVATAGGVHVLSVTRLADIIGNSTAGLDADVALQIATLWANYQLLGMAGADNDSLRRKDVLDYALWASTSSLRYQKYREQIGKNWPVSVATDSERYARGEILAARHVLVRLDSTATPAMRQQARAEADSIRLRLTPANLARFAREYGDSASGDLGVFGRQDMVPAFERALLALTPGTISAPVETEFGYHLIYRPRFSEVRDSAAQLGRDLAVAEAELQHRARIEQQYRIRVLDAAVAKARMVGRSVAAAAGDRSVLATYTGGQLTAAEFADWIEAFPASAGMIPRLIRGPDSMVLGIVQRIARSEVELRLADSVGIRVDAAEMDALLANMRGELALNWSQLKVGPSELSAAATTTAERHRIASRRIEEYFDRMVKEEAPYVDVPVVLARALRKRYALDVNQAALDEVVRRATVVRATLDSARAATAPVPGSNPTAVPTPGGQPTRRPPVTRPPGN